MLQIVFERLVLFHTWLNLQVLITIFYVTLYNLRHLDFGSKIRFQHYCEKTISPILVKFGRMFKHTKLSIFVKFEVPIHIIQAKHIKLVFFRCFSVLVIIEIISNCQNMFTKHYILSPLAEAIWVEEPLRHPTKLIIIKISKICLQKVYLFP